MGDADTWPALWGARQAMAVFGLGRARSKDEREILLFNFAFLITNIITNLYQSTYK